MGKFKVGDRVRLLRDNTYARWGKQGEEGTVMAVTASHTDCLVNFDESGKWYAQWDDLEHVVAVAPATATLTIEAGRYYKTRDGRKVGPMEGWREGAFREKEGDSRFRHPNGEGQVGASGEDLIAEWADGPAAVAEATAAVEIELVRAPSVGDSVLIPGWIAGITNAARGTNYNIVLETQNRRVSLHFLEEDFIVDPEQGHGDCVRANNDNDPVRTGDTAKAFDALANSIFGLTVRRAA